jgi:hypothetical protein
LQAKLPVFPDPAKGTRDPKCPMSHSVRGQRTHWVLQWAEEKMAESTEVICTVTKVVTTDMMDVGLTFLIENLPYHVRKYRTS